MVTTENTPEGRALVQRVHGPEDPRAWIHCAGLSGQMPWACCASCTGDSGFCMSTVARHEQLPLILLRLCDELDRQLIAVQEQEAAAAPDDQVDRELRVVLHAHHGKHQPVALANLVGQVLRSRGWFVRVRHMAAQYTGNRCMCAFYGPDDRVHGRWCPEVVWKLQEEGCLDGERVGPVAVLGAAGVPAHRARGLL